MLRNSCVVGKGKLMLQRRCCQSMVPKEAELKPTPSSAGVMVRIAENLIGIAYKVAVGGVGFVIGGLISSAEAPEVSKDIESIAESIKKIENNEIELENLLARRVEVEKK